MVGYLVIVSFAHSYHLDIKIDTAVAAVLGVFTTVMGMVPKFKMHGGSPRENLALQNIQVATHLYSDLSVSLKYMI